MNPYPLEPMNEIFICRHCRCVIEHAYKDDTGIYRHMAEPFSGATWCGTVAVLAEPLDVDEDDEYSLGGIRA